MCLDKWKQSKGVLEEGHSFMHVREPIHISILQCLEAKGITRDMLRDTRFFGMHSALNRATMSH